MQPKKEENWLSRVSQVVWQCWTQVPEQVALTWADQELFAAQLASSQEQLWTTFGSRCKVFNWTYRSRFFVMYLAPSTVGAVGQTLVDARAKKQEGDCIKFHAPVHERIENCLQDSCKAGTKNQWSWSSFRWFRNLVSKINMSTW